jgi:hypothetical protein
MLLGGAAAVTLCAGLASPGLAQATTAPHGSAAWAKYGADHRDNVGEDEGGVRVDVDVTGNNNGGGGGDASGATANNNGNIHDIIGGIAKADADAKAEAKAEAKAHNGHHKHHRR